LNKIKKSFLFELKDKFAELQVYYKLKKLFKLLKLEKWQTLKKESTSNGGGMVSGVLLWHVLV
jgi:hypothetical protein